MVAQMDSRRATLPASSVTEFGQLLRVLRERARLTRRELGVAVGYSEAQIGRLEREGRRPDPDAVAAIFLPALRLGAEPELAARLYELAVLPRGRQPAEQPQPGHPDARHVPQAGDLAAIPASPTHLVERTAVLAELRRCLGAERRVLMRGHPGMGKTTLAAGLARNRADAGGAVCWITLTAGVTTPAEAVIQLLAQSLARHGHREVVPLCDPGQLERPLPRSEQLHLITTTASRANALICLDNAELLRGEPETRAVIEHIGGSSAARILAISEEEVPLTGFAPFGLGGLARDAARALASRLAGRMLPAPLAEILIDQTGGSPLLIRLALGQLRPGGPDARALVDRLDREPRVARYLVQSTLAGLSEPGRRLISLLAVFRHPINLLDEQLIDASEALEGRYGMSAGLDELRRKQLVDHPARASLHPVAREFIYAGAGGVPVGRKGLHHLAAQHCERVLDDPLEASWHYAHAADPVGAAGLIAARTAELIASGRAGRAAALAGRLLASVGGAGDAERQLLASLGDLLVHTGRDEEAEKAYRAALAHPAPPALQAWVAGQLARSLLQWGRVPEALDVCRTATAGLTEREEVLRALLGAVEGQAHLMLSDFIRAGVVAEQACAAAGRIAAVTPGVADAVRARGYWIFGATARLSGQPDDAVGWLGRAVAAARGVGLRGVAGRALSTMGEMAHERGDIGSAGQFYQEALAELQAIGEGDGVARVLDALAAMRDEADAPDEAIKLFEDAAALKRRMGNPLGAANSEQALGLILLSQGRMEAARAVLAAALDSTGQHGDRQARAYCLDSLAVVDFADGDQRNARGHLAEAARIADEVDDPRLGTTIRMHSSYGYLASGDLPAAIRLAGTCAEQMARSGDVMPAGVALEYAALAACLALAAGELTSATAKAAELGAQASRVGDVRYRATAQRISVAIAAAIAGSPPPMTRLPRLVWVDDSR
jgi:ATP/maltotriose-dependent transcriptional regulator MalT/DNA-binding XRE family transcriptional regulator